MKVHEILELLCKNEAEIEVVIGVPLGEVEFEGEVGTSYVTFRVAEIRCDFNPYEGKRMVVIEGMPSELIQLRRVQK